MSVIEEVKSRLDIVEIISETTPLKKHRNYYSGLCPFHAHVNNTPSFAVWPDSGVWKCFGQCNTGGDVFTFVMKRDGVDFSEALRTLAHKAGIELRPRLPAEVAREEEHARLRELLARAATYFHNLLLHSPHAEAARQHILQRGLSVLTVEKFQLGYSLAAWDALLTYFADKGVNTKELIEAGLVIERSDGSGVYDRFRNRLMIPIHDAGGKIVGFGARALDPNDAPKFLNSPQTALFDKGRTLYGLSFARRAIRESGVAVIVEGYLDVMAAHQAGFANVVSPMGVALTEDHVRSLIRCNAKRLVLALDADEAGRVASRRGGEIGATAEVSAPIVDGYENIKKATSRKSVRVETRVMILPEGKDPDEVVLADSARWAELVQSAAPILEFIIQSALAGRDLDDPGVKADAAAELLPVIDQIADAVERDAYRQKLARLLRVSEAALLQKRTQPRGRAAKAAKAAPPAPTPANGQASKLEAYCLGALARWPELIYKADRQLQMLGLERLSEEDFTYAAHRAIFRAIKAALAQDAADPADHLRDGLDDSLLPALDAALAETAALHSPLDDPTVTDDVLNAVTRLRRRSVDSTLTRLRFLVEDAQSAGEQTDTFAQAIVRLAGARQKLDRALTANVRP